jgi:hypothetical protein
MTTRHAKTVWFFLLLFAVGVGALAANELRARRAEPTVGAWPAGARRVYTIAWRTRNAASLPGAPLVEGAVEIDGELALESQGVEEGALHLRFAFTRLDRAAVTLLGRDATAGRPEELAGPEAHALYEPDGRLRAVYVAAGAPPLFKHLAEALLVQLPVRLPEGAGALARVSPTTTPPTWVSNHWDHARDKWNAVRAEFPGMKPFEIEDIARRLDAIELALRKFGWNVGICITDTARRRSAVAPSSTCPRSSRRSSTTSA